MCRIAGILNTSIAIPFLENTVEQMCALLKHGGPDDGGIFTEATSHLVLGNRRLSLLDLSAAGHQPMHYGNRYTITYNGELYNYTTLKSELKAAGMLFSTGTDTEVILAAFEKWNIQSFAKLNGMFAFALWDNKEKKLYLVRDAAGIKPLYYSTASGALAFASEMRAFAPIEYLQKKNETAKVYQLAYGFIPEPVTTLAEVKPLPKGCFFAYDTKTQLGSLQSFSFFSFSDTIKDEVKVKEIIYNALEGAVQRQLVADAPVGVFLSGGIDSAIIANLANINRDKSKLHTLSIYFNEEKYSEKKYQDIVARSLHSTHHSILLKETNFHAHFPKILDAMDMPTCDGINTWFISKFAADEGLKAVLSGVGADELFGGYPSFSRMHKALLLQKLPKISLRVGGGLNVKKYGRISYLQIGGIRGLYLFLRGHFTPIEIAKQLGGYEKEVWHTLSECPTSPTLSISSEKNIASWMEFNIYMQDQLLRDADIMSMASGLEIRVPFLDNEMLKPVFGTDSKLKFGGKISKQLLIDSFDKILPTEIWDRPKMGFSFPFAEWLANSKYVRALEQSKNVHTQKACKDFLQGKLHWSRIMSLIVLKNKLAAQSF
jgi:asparagine synthase (glutamine-hydrolysing)